MLIRPSFVICVCAVLLAMASAAPPVESDETNEIPKEETTGPLRKNGEPAPTKPAPPEGLTTTAVAQEENNNNTTNGNDKNNSTSSIAVDDTDELGILETLDNVFSFLINVAKSWLSGS